MKGLYFKYYGTTICLLIMDLEDVRAPDHFPECRFPDINSPAACKVVVTGVYIDVW